MANARSIHVGLNHLDPDAYNGWDGELFGCINDARDMQTIAESLGYESLLLTDSAATSCRVISEIGRAAADLESGDILFLSYSGHGSQVDDVNGEEEDAADETWCLWDRQLVDDELYCLWSRFAPGVRIVMLSDSCHSGTMARATAAAQDLSRELVRTRSAMAGSHAMRRRPATQPRPDAAALQASALDSLSKVLGFVPAKTTKSMVSPAPGAPARAVPQAGSYDRPRIVPPDLRGLINKSQAATLAAAQWLAGPSERAQIGAAVLLISGCQDYQLSLDGLANGLFTQRLKQVWDDGNFSGDYYEFWSAICAVMPARQQPNYFTVGATNAAFEAQCPFDTAVPGGVYAPPLQPTPRPHRVSPAAHNS